MRPDQTSDGSEYPKNLHAYVIIIKEGLRNALKVAISVVRRMKMRLLGAT